MPMCPICGNFEGHLFDCPRIDELEDSFFPKEKPKPKFFKKRKFFGVPDSEQDDEEDDEPE